ncbi:outer membrane protein assembly factor BamA [Sphingomonadaceae bacterium OTU29MARTA1]|nr:outer membrane protein assembly factor BamA [Sphingomonas sp. Leaf37]USU05501.1 outer membrane protein assembly factor BamA [Sphingomonadaceae bacterium OTU29LAMAA1]USU09175.1 outer membrane protein assembly factor BamA [Sphingomonadaceae bacterium OTU29MARTA1]USU12573.1 outer membrane protein assembly factor BamA [Sphingomonadaceae bacterium OTU29THOMA1]
MKSSMFVARGAALLAGTMLSGVPVMAQTAPAPASASQPVVAPAPAAGQSATPAPVRTIKTLRVEGSQRIEPETVLSYTKLRVGIPYTAETLDQALKDLQASDLFVDFSISGVETGDIVLRIRENPIINRVILEGNKALKSDKITKEIKLAPRQIFTRTAVRQDVSRIIELYRRQGRFAAVISPKMVSLDQNRVDVVFEITEGPKSKVRQINIIGNEVFEDGKLRGEMATKESRWFRLLSSSTSYDQDRLNYDQQKLRQYYLTQGYADFRVTSAVAELTPDKRDFIITYVVEEGKRYKFGDVSVDSEIRDFDNKKLAASLPIKKGEWYNAKLVEDSVDQLSESAGLFGYAFTDVSPDFQRDPETLTMGMNFHIGQAQRTYIERIDINGNTQTQDKVVRREIRLAEGDAFNSFQVKRSQDRINSLGFFQDKMEIKQNPGSAPDRIILETNLEEKSTGELQLSVGYSSLERFIVQANITQNNFRGKGQVLRAGVNYSSYSKSIELGFTEPYLFDKNVAIGVDVFRRDFNSFNYVGQDRQTTYSQVSTGFQVRTGVPLTEYWSLAGRYGLSYDQVGLDESTYYTNGQCDRLRAGRYLCEAIGNRWTSSIGYSLIYDSLNSRLRPTAGQRLSFSQDFAGLGGDVKYIRTRLEGSKFWNVGSGFIGSIVGEGGYIKSLEKSRGLGVDSVRITDRFYLGEPQFRGFDIRGIGPRVQRASFTTDANGKQIAVTDRDQIVDDALGGNAYYLVRAELEIPLGAGARELGLRPSIYVQAGSLFSLTRPQPTATFPTITDANGNVTVLPLTTPVLDSAGRQLYLVSSADTTNAGAITTCAIGYAAVGGGACSGSSTNTIYQTSTPAFQETYYGSRATPRISVGVGVNWNSPFGPLRIDLAKALVTQKGDDPKLITFNVGTQF